MTAKYIAMIPARLGSQRLKQKNLQPLEGRPLIAHAIEKCLNCGLFDQVWVNTEADEIGEVAVTHGAQYHKRPAELANNVATSEQFVAEFFDTHECEAVFQVHSIAPLLSETDIAEFVKTYDAGAHDTLISCIHDQIEVALDDQPVNFTFAEKTNSQDLAPVQRITWAISAWRRSTYLEAFNAGNTATYSGRIGFYPVNPISGHVIKRQSDLDMAAAMLPLMREES